jgi:serine phosphatase RsbU (regulator of sigma subunit)
MEGLKGEIVEWSAASKALHGERRSGDLFVARPFANGYLVGVVDGLGHGEEAADAAQQGIQILEEHADESVISLIYRCHERLRSTRGATMSLASFSAADDGMTWLGVGNVEGMLLRAEPDGGHRLESLMLRGGVVGGKLPQLHGSIVHVRRGDMLIFATDGVRVGFDSQIAGGRSPDSIARRILDKFTKGTDDALVLVARYNGPSR